MRMRRIHAIQMARELQRQKNQDARRLKPKRRSLLSFLPDLRQESPDGIVLDESVRAKIDELLCQLDERESYIIRLYFGLEGEEPLTLEQIGGLMNLTRERVRQLKERALGKLRCPEGEHVLLSLADESEVY